MSDTLMQEPGKVPVATLEETAELFAAEGAELDSFGIDCEEKSRPEVLDKIYQVIELLQPLARDGFTVTVPAIARQLASKTDSEDWNLLITEPEGGLYARVFSDISALKVTRFPFYNIAEQKLISELYDRVREEASDKIGECIALLLNIKFLLHQTDVAFSVRDIDKFSNSLSVAVSS